MFAVGLGEEMQRKYYLRNVPRVELVSSMCALAIDSKEVVKFELLCQVTERIIMYCKQK